MCLPKPRALASLLLWDSASPMYAAGPGASVSELVDAILELTQT